MKRTHNNGELRLKDVNKEVTIIGWVAKKRNLGSLVFIDLRDRYGITQVVVKEEFSSITEQIHNEYILQVTGIVTERESKNKDLSTGDIEVVATNISIINSSAPLPMIIADKTDALEDTRLKYRYLDLRRPVMQQKLIKRHKITQSFRNFLDKRDFIEVETPVLTSTTPEGARDYLVPSRVNPGKFYALPQSPQLFKQLLMISGIERYYQVARCFRDEDLRSDRQPDFTQLDIEMSFLDENETMQIIEEMFVNMFKEVENYDIVSPIRRISYKEVMERYGSDKPDTRFGYELIEASNIFTNTSADILKGKICKCVNAKGLNAVITRKEIDELTYLAKKQGCKQLFFFRYADNQLSGSLVKNMSESEINNFIKTCNAENGDLIFMVADEYFEVVCNSLGQVRIALGHKYEAEKLVGYDLLWVVDFPLLERNSETGALDAVHHPFTRPFDEDLPLLETDPLKVRSHHYDLVLNGYELGSGSLRIYDHDVQQKVFELIGLTDDDINRKFGYFINAFQYGTPPHAGIGLGLDRIAMILTGSSSIRDVIAFPKNASASCPLTGAPTVASEKQLQELHIQIKKDEE